MKMIVDKETILRALNYWMDGTHPTITATAKVTDFQPDYSVTGSPKFTIEIEEEKANADH